MRLAATRRLLLASLGMAVASAAAAAQAPASRLEYAIKATYRYKLANFVEWPASVRSGPFNLCIIGNDPFGPILDAVTAGQTVNGRPIVVRRFQVISGNPGCHTMYLAGSASQSIMAMLGQIRGQPILTVTSVPKNEPVKGIINFIVANNHVLFEIDNVAATEAGLAISSKLLGLAASVRTRPP